MTAAPRATTVALISRSPDETAGIAGWLAPRLGAGDTVLLEGPIGAGKTAFARALIQARLAAEGLSEDVPSPTFTLVQEYRAGDLAIVHADLYRLGSAGEAAELGLEEAARDALCLIEWPDRLGAALPADALTIRFEPGPDPDTRRITLLSRAPRTAGMLAELGREKTLQHV